MPLYSKKDVFFPPTNTLFSLSQTSFTLSWATYLLAKHPEVQQSIYKEIVSNLGKDKVPDAYDIPNLPLIRALLKETLRQVQKSDAHKSFQSFLDCISI